MLPLLLVFRTNGSKFCPVHNFISFKIRIQSTRSVIYEIESNLLETSVSFTHFLNFFLFKSRPEILPPDPYSIH